MRQKPKRTWYISEGDTKDKLDDQENKLEVENEIL